MIIIPLLLRRLLAGVCCLVAPSRCDHSDHNAERESNECHCPRQRSCLQPRRLLGSLEPEEWQPPPPQLWNSSEGKVTVTINTRGCLVQLECIRLISQLPDSGTIASIATRESDGKILNTVSVLQSNY